MAGRFWQIFFLFLQTKPSFCQMFAWPQLDFSAIPVSISAGRQTWQNVNSKRRLQRMHVQLKGKDIRKKIYLAAFVFFPYVFGEKFPTAEF
jgi:hypothetical protein